MWPALPVPVTPVVTDVGASSQPLLSIMQRADVQMRGLADTICEPIFQQLEVLARRLL